MCGNPTKTSGTFFDSHNRDSDIYKVHVVNSELSKRTNKENIAAMKRKYGADSNFVRIRVYGEFPLQEDDVFIPISLIESARQQEGDSKVDSIDIGVDVARFGDDETVIAQKIGSTVPPLKVRQGQDTMKTVGDVVIICKQLREKYPNYRGKIKVKIDDTGVGGGVTDRLNELVKENGWYWIDVIPVNFANKVESAYYHNITTYMWAEARALMEKDLLQLPDDDELVAQFSVRKYSVHSSGKLVIESKADMKKRGIKSPDRADAVALCCFEGFATTPLGLLASMAEADNW